MLCPNWWSLGGRNVVKYDLTNPVAAVALFWGAEHAQRLEDASLESLDLARQQIAFWPGDFTSTPAMTAFHKWVVASEFVAFVRSNCARSKFTPTLYRTLMRLFRHERVRPHKDPTRRARNFHYAHFDCANNRRNFFERIAESDPTDLQQPGMVDLARALRAYTIQHVMPVVAATERHATAVRERGQLRWLLRRYGLPEDFRLPRQK